MSGNSLVGVPEPITLSTGTPNNWRHQVPSDMRYTSPAVVAKPQFSDSSLSQYRRMVLTDPWKMYQTQQALARAGYMSLTKASMAYTSDFQTAMASAMTDANYSGGLSLETLFAMRGAGAASAGVKGPGRGPGSGSSTSTNTSKSYSITSRASAQQLLKSSLAKELGREPQEWEINRFVASLNKDEHANPGVSTTVTHSSASGSSSSTTSTPSSVDPQAKADQYGRTVSPTERHMYQDKNYYDVIAQMVGGL